MTNSPGFLGRLRARILVAHNHAGIVERIGYLVESHFDVVAIISDGLAAVDARRLKPNLVVLHMIMPQRHGIQAAQELKRQGCESRWFF